MTFEEFFSKKRIDLTALQKAEPALFAEFKTHYEQMGEKSFDHTKKYWFNKLRLQYHLAPEPKTEKVIIEKPAAEQTIAQTLSETTTPSPNVGFKPRFKAGMTKPAEPKEETKAPEVEKTAETPGTGVPKPGFTPRFKAGMTKTVNPAPEQKEELKTTPEQPAKDKPGEDTPKPAYQPRFNMKNIKPKGEE